MLLLLPLLLIQTAEEETVVYFLSEPVSVPEDKKIAAGSDLVLNSLMAAHTRVHEFSPHQPVNPPPKDDYYMMFG